MKKIQFIQPPYQDPAILTDRRSFVRDIAILSGMGLTAMVIGCEVRHGQSLQRDANGEVKTVIMKDLFVLRFSTNPGRPVEVLPVENIAKGLPTMFLWMEKTHSHSYTIDPSHYERLKRGETIVITSTINEGHTHSFMIDPKVAVESSVGMKVPLLNIPEASGLDPTTFESLLKVMS